MGETGDGADKTDPQAGETGVVAGKTYPRAGKTGDGAGKTDPQAGETIPTSRSYKLYYCVGAALLSDQSFILVFGSID